MVEPESPAEPARAAAPTVPAAEGPAGWAGPRPMRGPLRVLLLALGVTCTGIGALGVVLPLLPTTPFLLLAAVCFARASPRLHDALLAHRVLGPYIRDYRNGTMTRGQLIRTIGLLWASLLLSAVLVAKPVVWAVLGVIGGAVSWHLLSMRRR
ncbi:YbaN family protein [Corynebacterium sphenisci]|uniref:YbaN family protein n=1 Tax=Corynebacterium sphenisci TaxID=191493 RepID=UPI0026E10BD2|nr:YbaN family protein [Corynebacterium sphenisci]MDO5731204.1 YbaN family protein [Corynebacterium sphenisci]